MLNIQADVLLKAIKPLFVLIEKIPQLPVLDCFNFKTNGNQLTVTSTNLDSFYSVFVPIENANNIEWEFNIEAKKIIEILKIKKKNILAFNVEELILKVKDGKSVYSLVIDADVFPQYTIENLEKTSEFYLPKKYLSEIFSAANKDIKKSYPNLYFLQKNNLGRIIATNGLILKSIEFEVKNKNEFEFSLHPDDAKFLCKIMSDKVAFCINKDINKKIILTGNYVLIVNSQSYHLPNSNLLFESEILNTFKINLIDIQDKLKEFLTIETYKNCIDLHFSNNSLKLTIVEDLAFSNPITLSETTIECILLNEDSLSFNKTNLNSFFQMPDATNTNIEINKHQLNNKECFYCTMQKKIDDFVFKYIVMALNPLIEQKN